MPAPMRRHSNERLEFLGDRVLGLVVAEKLCTRFIPTMPKARWRCELNALVRWRGLRPRRRSGRALAIISFWPDRKRPAAAAASGRHPVGSACEAVIAALYLDGGMAAARAFIERYWTDVRESRRRHARRQDPAAGMGARARRAAARRAGLYAGRPRRSRPCAAFCGARREVTGLAPERARAAPSARPNRMPPPSCWRRSRWRHHDHAAVSAPSSAPPMPASPR